jgi:hypothetical protein
MECRLKAVKPTRSRVFVENRRRIKAYVMVRSPGYHYVSVPQARQMADRTVLTTGVWPEG